MDRAGRPLLRLSLIAPLRVVQVRLDSSERWARKAKRDKIMGWMYQYQQVRDVKHHIEHNESLFTSSVPGHAYEVLDSAIVGSTYYAAVRRTTPDHAPYVFATVILFRNPKSGFGYKDMDESMGPNEVACPLRILAKLSPFEDMPGGLANRGYAAQWRESVRAYHRAKAEQTKTARSFNVGDKIKLPEPVSFFKGQCKVDTFTVQTYLRRGKHMRVYSAPGVGLCKLPQCLLDGAVKVAA